MQQPVYYVHVDEQTGELAFSSATTDKQFTEKPPDGIFLDRTTREPYSFPPHLSECSSPIADGSIPDLPAVVARRPGEARRRRRAGVALDFDAEPINSTRLHEIVGLDLPPDFWGEPPLRATQSAPTFPLPHRLNPLFDTASDWLIYRGFSEASFPRGLQFQAEPIKRPLLPLVGKSVKLALESFKAILKYTKPSPKPRVASAKKLVTLALENAHIADEIFCQLVKQTTHNRDPQCLLLAWELFLIVATCIPSSPRGEGDVKEYLARESKGADPRVVDFARFTFIRFSARCEIGSPLTPIKSELLSRIPLDMTAHFATFTAPIAEHLWLQRHTHPELSIPLFLRTLTKAILAKGAERMEGVFRLSGSAARVQEMIAEINRGTEPRVVFQHAALVDLTQIFKHWFTSLGERVINSRLAPALIAAYESDKDYFGLLEQLPSAHLEVLKFLCAFIRRMAAAEATTKMSIKNYAIVLGPGLLANGPSGDQFSAVKNTMVSQEFLLALLRDCDVTIPDGFFEDRIP
jgi:hypothetical protein